MPMRDIWNPWHGCEKYSEGCENCYMYFLDKEREVAMPPSELRKTKNFDYPLKKDRRGDYKIRPGEILRVNMTGDSFQPEAREWLREVWDIVRIRSDVIFYFVTKRVPYIEDALPPDWGEGYGNVMLNATIESQRAFDERWPIFERIPAVAKGILCSPILSYIDLEPALKSGQICQVSVAGENYDGCRPSEYSWIERMSRQCIEYKTTFRWHETGNVLIYKNSRHFIPKWAQQRIAGASGLSFQFELPTFILRDPVDKHVLTAEDIMRTRVYNPDHCLGCVNKPACNGCYSGCPHRDKSKPLYTYEEMRELEEKRLGRAAI